ncbi:hypothetical protein F4808DRAFT_271700 [Astrocystis sublimbata]|nr:hypothetical protein F4808DRAFT_271700 [Astrocystis sublimbata]
MPSIKITTLALGALALAGISQAFTLKFWDEADACASEYADSTRTRTPGLTVNCDTVLLETRTVLIQDWDSKCRLVFWAEDKPCIGDGVGNIYEPIYNSSMSEAKEDMTAIFDEDSNQACLENLFDDVNVGYYSYFCEGDDGDSDE